MATYITEEELLDEKEEDTKRKYITPIVDKQWGPNVKMEHNVKITVGKIDIKDGIIKRKAPKRADYLTWADNKMKLAVLEAKGEEHNANEGLAQAIEYAEMMDIPFAYASNGFDLIEYDRITKKYRNLKIDELPSRETLWKRFKSESALSNDELEMLNIQPYVNHAKRDGKTPRYYQVNAINRVTNAIAKGQKKILLVMATGSGKTYVGKQIVYKLKQSGKVKKVLYLCDRTNLANQTLPDFKEIYDTAATILDNSKITEASASKDIFIGLYQQLFANDTEYYKQFPSDYFDLIIVDECHRGSAAEYSNWRKILDYFGSAIQIGLTATQKETKTVSNREYFGEPVYTYSLKQGIEDGYLSPYTIRVEDLDMDLSGYITRGGEKDINGHLLEAGIKYERKDFDKKIIINSRRKIVSEIIANYQMRSNGDFSDDKMIIFCETEEHAADMVQRLRELMPEKVAENEHYIEEITSVRGKEYLDSFKNPNEKYPVIAVTVDLISTGVDTKTCKTIVLDTNIDSYILYAQIKGRGTRIEERYSTDNGKTFESKMFFTIIDFRGNYRKFEDPAFDGEPEYKYDEALAAATKPRPASKSTGKKIIQKIEGRTFAIENEKVIITDENFNRIEVNILSNIRHNILEKYPTVEKFKKDFQSANHKDNFLNKLCLDEQQHLYDIYDLSIDKYDCILNLCYGLEIKTKIERLEKIYSSTYYNELDVELQNILNIILNEYLKQDFERIKKQNILSSMTGVLEKETGKTGIEIFKEYFKSNANKYKEIFNNLESILYEGE